MNRMLTIAAVAVACSTWLAADIADARRLGGGRSMGAQRQMTPAPAPSAPSAAPSSPGAAQPSMAPRTAAGAAAAPAAARSGMSRWLGPIAGLAAGLGLAALLSHFGLSDTFATFLMLALLVGGGLLLARFLFARRNAASPMRYAPAAPQRVEPQIGRTSSAFEPVMSATPNAPAAASRFPPGFDAAAFEEQAKQQFRRLQASYDTGDRQAMSDVMTPQMLEEAARDLAQRTSHEPTIVDRLDAEILDVATEGGQHWMSVRFTGLLREDGTLLPKELDETWNLVKPVDGSSGWLLAGIQQAHEMA